MVFVYPSTPVSISHLFLVPILDLTLLGSGFFFVFVFVNSNHAVTLVGYGVGQKRGKEMPFWRVMNSWGTKFGEDGYFRLFRGDNHCAIADYAVVGVV